ncbi:MAG: DNA-binding beta-propeller fold protein YncE [Cyclobacteriaceae bacterium]|jgi:DNA-binding beta-propeller fold protein YncE
MKASEISIEMVKNITVFFLLIASVSLPGQHYDNHWMMGYFGGSESSPTDSFGISILSFFDATLRIENDQSIDLFFDGSGNSLSNFSGDLLLYSNNLEIRNAEDEVIENGVLEANGEPEKIFPQSFVYLPFSENNLVYYLQISYTDDFPRLGKSVSSSLIETQGIIGVSSQVENILQDSLSIGHLTACRHANGRDWWVLVAKANSSLVFSILLSPHGVTRIDTTVVDHNMFSGLGQSVFSPDGERFVRVSLVGGQEVVDYLDVFDFDRDSGKLSNQRRISIGPNAGAGGVAVSASSQFLYVSHTNYLYQYDLWDENIATTKDTVAIYDGFQETNFFSTTFFLAQLAPDGKIYLNSPSGVRKLHVIESPDERGGACDVRQHSISLPNFNAFTLANHPNYRLGPIDGGLSDTLGIDNLPRAYYRIDRRAEDSLWFHFQDLSFFEPTSWSWTFGDGGNSLERHPNHTYATSGIYEVCLTVSNATDSDTYCRTLELGPSSIQSQQPIEFKVFPNPTQGIAVFDLGNYMPLNGKLMLYDGNGRKILEQQFLYSQAQINLVDLPPAIYHYSFWDGGQQLGQGKIIRSR